MRLYKDCSQPSFQLLTKTRTSGNVPNRLSNDLVHGTDAKLPG